MKNTENYAPFKLETASRIMFHATRNYGSKLRLSPIQKVVIPIMMEISALSEVKKPIIILEISPKKPRNLPLSRMHTLA